MKSSSAFVLACIIMACNNQPSQLENDPLKGEQSSFPVTDFLNSQIHMVDSLQLPVLKMVTINNMTDSVQISLDEFKALAQEFLQPDISDPSISRFYEESSFADQSIPSVTLTYFTQNKDLEIRRVDVNINPDPVLHDKVKSIYLEKQHTQNDTSLYKKLYWRADRNFQIVINRQVPEQPATVRIIKCVWDFTE